MYRRLQVIEMHSKGCGMSFKLPKQYQIAGLLSNEFVAKRGGTFIVISACINDGRQKVKIDFAEWPLICDAVERLRKKWTQL